MYQYFLLRQAPELRVIFFVHFSLCSSPLHTSVTVMHRPPLNPSTLASASPPPSGALSGLSSLAAAVAAAAVAPPTSMPTRPMVKHTASSSADADADDDHSYSAKAVSASRSRSPPTASASAPSSSSKEATPTPNPLLHSQRHVHHATARRIACRFREESCPVSFPNNFSRRSHEIEVCV